MNVEELKEGDRIETVGTADEPSRRGTVFMWFSKMPGGHSVMVRWDGMPSHGHDYFYSPPTEFKRIDQ